MIAGGALIILAISANTWTEARNSKRAGLKPNATVTKIEAV